MACIGPDPRTWGREDVLTFLRWCEREFDLPGLDLDKFQMNGKGKFELDSSKVSSFLKIVCFLQNAYR